LNVSNLEDKKHCVEGVTQNGGVGRSWGKISGVRG